MNQRISNRTRPPLSADPEVYYQIYLLNQGIHCVLGIAIKCCVYRRDFVNTPTTRQHEALVQKRRRTQDSKWTDSGPQVTRRGGKPAYVASGCPTSQGRREEVG